MTANSTEMTAPKSQPGAAHSLSVPSHISPDGGELLDWAARFSTALHRQARIVELNAEIAKVRCGDCSHWMKSRECPRERNVNGWNHGPSCEDLPCQLFIEDSLSTKLREEWRAERGALRAAALAAVSGTPQESAQAK